MKKINKLKKVKINALVGFAVLIIFAVVTSVAGIYIGEKLKRVEEIPTIVVQAPELPSQYPDYDAIKGKNPDPDINPAVVTNDCPEGGCVNNKPTSVEYDGKNKKYRAIGQFSRAYLYIEALVDYERPLTVWDDFVFRINGVGGHFVIDDNQLPVPPSRVTKYLYDLRSISYYPLITDKQKRINRRDDINLFSLLRDGALLNMTAYISSDRPGRVMREVTIYYECSEGSDCKIEELK